MNSIVKSRSTKRRSAAAMMLATTVALAGGFGIGRIQQGDGQPPRETDSSAPRPVAHADAAVEAACAASAAPLDPATAALSREVAELKEQVAALIAAGNAQPAGEAMADMRRQLAALQREHAPEEPPIEPTSAEVERERRLQMAELEADFWQESANAKWSNEASTAVLEALETEDTDQIEVRSLECRSQTCRVELASDVPEALNGLPVLLLKLAKTLPNAVASQVENADGSRSTVLYMTTKANGAPSPQG